MDRNRWRVAFLGVTALVGALALTMELVFSFDGDPATEPWTVLIVDHVPPEIAVAIFGALVAWLPVHFWIRYRRRAKARAAAKTSAAPVPTTPEGNP